MGKMFIVPDNMLEELTCDFCHKYLSVGPVKVDKNRRKKCGRCVIDNNETEVTSVYRHFGENAIFKCINRFEGCEELLTYHEVINHETECLSKKYQCPLCKDGIEMETFRLLHHFKKYHYQNFLKNSILRIELNDIQKFEKNSGILYLNAFHIGGRYEVYNIQQKYNVFIDGLKILVETNQRKCLPWQNVQNIEWRIDSQKIDVNLQNECVVLINFQFFVPVKIVTEMTNKNKMLLYSNDGFTGPDVKLHETDNPSQLVRFYKKVCDILYTHTPQKFVKLLPQFTALKVETLDQLQILADAVYDRAVHDPKFSVICAKISRELALLDVPMSNSISPDKKENIVTFRKILITRCQMEFEQESVDETARNAKLKEIEKCKDPHKKKDLQFDLEKYDRKLRMKSVGNVRFIGELFKQEMITANIMVRCLYDLLEKEDEESLECLCVLLTTISKELVSRGVDLTEIFNTMTTIARKNEKGNSKISNRVRLMLQDIINRIGLSLKRNANKYHGLISRLGSQHPSANEPSSAASSQRSTPSPRSRPKAAIPTMTTDLSKSSAPPLSASVSYPSGAYISNNTTSSIPPMPEGQMDRSINNSIDEYISGNANINEFFQAISSCIPASYYSTVITTSYFHVFKQKQNDRLKTGELFAKLVQDGQFSLDDYCTGLEDILSEAGDLKITLPNFWDMVAEMLVDIVIQEVLSLDRLFELLKKQTCQSDISKLLSSIFKLIVVKKGAAALQKLRQKSKLRLTDFLDGALVRSLVNDNQVEFLLEDSAPASQKQISFEEIQEQLSALLRKKAKHDEIFSWITENVGDKVKESKFIRTLATAIFENSISPDFKLQKDALLSNANLLLKYLDNNLPSELEGLCALEALIHKLKHPQVKTNEVAIRGADDYTVSTPAGEYTPAPGNQGGNQDPVGLRGLSPTAVPLSSTQPNVDLKVQSLKPKSTVNSNNTLQQMFHQTVYPVQQSPVYIPFNVGNRQNFEQSVPGYTAPHFQYPFNPLPSLFLSHDFYNTETMVSSQPAVQNFHTAATIKRRENCIKVIDPNTGLDRLEDVLGKNCDLPSGKSYSARPTPQPSVSPMAKLLTRNTVKTIQAAAKKRVQRRNKDSDKQEKLQDDDHPQQHHLQNHHLQMTPPPNSSNQRETTKQLAAFITDLKKNADNDDDDIYS